MNRNQTERSRYHRSPPCITLGKRWPQAPQHTPACLCSGVAWRDLLATGRFRHDTGLSGTPGTSEECCGCRAGDSGDGALPGCCHTGVSINTSTQFRLIQSWSAPWGNKGLSLWGSCARGPLALSPRAPMGNAIPQITCVTSFHKWAIKSVSVLFSDTGQCPSPGK